eukprot:TRINITY_DN13047_c0_g1_i1.p1 TRINITY_DN13047_c0_g1~~TRINITY_DN13047_c0_g1_i1.p1  ORF type:complete len:317 (+),score=43.39 TRINITY_DN13047_c0_g1_i1:113-1063(+)
MMSRQLHTQQQWRPRLKLQAQYLCSPGGPSAMHWRQRRLLLLRPLLLFISCAGIWNLFSAVVAFAHCGCVVTAPSLRVDNRHGSRRFGSKGERYYSDLTVPEASFRQRRFHAHAGISMYANDVVRRRAVAAATATSSHLGQRLAAALQASSGLPDWAVLMLVSALPLVELRGGVPVGLWLGFRAPQVLVLSVLGNIAVIPPFLWALQHPRVEQLLAPFLARARRKTSGFSAEGRWRALAAFVGVPLPGTGAWTGAMVAYVLGMEFWPAILAIFVGVCAAACMMVALTLAGWYGCAAAACLIAAASGTSYKCRVSSP